MSPTQDDVSRWLTAARIGDQEALGRLLETSRNYLLLVANSHLDPDLRGKGSASDLVQESFLEAQRDLGGFCGTTEGECLAWLRQILRHNIGAFTRRHRAGKRDVRHEVVLSAPDSAAPVAEPADRAMTPSSEAIDRENAIEIRRALDRLPDDYRQVITMRYLEGRSFEEIAVALGRSQDAARKLWGRAMRRLREEWGGPT